MHSKNVKSKNPYVTIFISRPMKTSQSRFNFTNPHQTVSFKRTRYSNNSREDFKLRVVGIHLRPCRTL